MDNLGKNDKFEYDAKSNLAFNLDNNNDNNSNQCKDKQKENHIVFLLFMRLVYNAGFSF